MDLKFKEAQKIQNLLQLDLLEVTAQLQIKANILMLIEIWLLEHIHTD